MKKMDTKKIAKVISIAIVVVTILQLLFMFVPIFTYEYKDEGTKTASMQDYAWGKTAAMKKYKFQPLDRKYNINDYVTGIVLTFLLGVLTVVFTLLNSEGIVSIVFSLGYGGVSVWTFLTGEIFQYGATGLKLGPVTYDASTIVTISLVLSIIAAVLVLARVYPWLEGRFLAPMRYRKAKIAEYNAKMAE